MPRIALQNDVFTEALDRLLVLYAGGHRIVCSFSGGKDSTICVELCIIAASMTGRLPVDVMMRDEEIMFPGTFEYAERMQERPEVRFHWLIANQPIVNVFNREAPYFWVFDPLLDPEQWVRKPPAIAQHIDDINIEHITIPSRFPPEPGKELYAVVGLRTQESRTRLYSIFSSKGYLTKTNPQGTRNARPIYDWTDGDVWRAIRENHWDYNIAYDSLMKMGMPRARLRIAPPTLNYHGLEELQLAARIWPKWFDRVCQRLPGVRSVTLFGKRAAQPTRHGKETWQEVFQRECIEDAPGWIADRATQYSTQILRQHARHSTTPFPDMTPCRSCFRNVGSWRALCYALYNGDPFSLKADLPYVEPEFFRAGAGRWGGIPTF